MKLSITQVRNPSAVHYVARDLFTKLIWKGMRDSTLVKNLTVAQFAQRLSAHRMLSRAMKERTVEKPLAVHIVTRVSARHPI